MNETTKTVLEIASASLLDKTISSAGNTDWQTVFNEIKKHSIVSLTYPVIQNSNIPINILQNYKIENDKYLLNNAKNIACHIAVHQILHKTDIPYVILKGVASGSYYPNYLLRAYGDVDILVNPDDFDKTSDLLISNGYKHIEDSKKHRVFEKGGTIYELHDHIFRNTNEKLNNTLDQFFSDIIEQSNTFKHNNSICMIPSHRHHALILLLHSAQHIAESGIGLRHLLDWAVFINKMDDDFFLQEMQPILKETGLWKFSQILTALCTKYLGLKNREWTSEVDTKYLEDLIEDIFKYGEFGRAYRNMEPSSNKISNHDTVKSFLSIINKSAKKLQPIKKIPILLPVGWIYIILRYLLNTITGKRTIKNAKSIIVKTAEKKYILQEWNLFENEE